MIVRSRSFRGLTLKELREDWMITARELERETGISNSYIIQLEKGVATNPSINVVILLSTYFGVPVERFITG